MSQTDKLDCNNGTNKNDRNGQTISEITANKKEKNKKETFADENFSLDDELIKWAQKKYPKISVSELNSQKESFIDNAISKGLKYADWRAAYRTWIRNAVKWEKIDYSNTGENSPLSNSGGSPPKVDGIEYVKGTHIERFERNPDGTFNQNRYSSEAIAWINKNASNFKNNIYLKKHSGKEKLTELEA